MLNIPKSFIIYMVPPSPDFQLEFWHCTTHISILIYFKILKNSVKNLFLYLISK